MQLYYLYAKGAANVRRDIIRKEDVEKLITIAREENKMLFLSYYLYDQEALEHLRIRKTIAGFRGSFYIDNLILDLDDHNKERTFNENKVITLEFINNLSDDWEVDYNSIRIWFSGRGYHIETPDFFGFNNTNLTPYEVKSTFEKYFPQVDAAPMSSNGMIRANYTINPKVNLYKVPFSYEEFVDLTEEKLYELAKDPRPKRHTPLPTHDKLHTELILKSKERVKASYKIGNYSNVVTCIQKMYETDGQTHRHQRMLPMISTFRRNGLTQKAVTILMKEWVKRQTGDKEYTDYEVERNVEDVYKTGYTFGCNDKYMSEFCDPACMFYARKNYTMEMATVDQMHQELITYINSGVRDRAIDLNSVFPTIGSFKIAPKELVVLWGDSGLGKTALAQNISIKLKKKTLFIELEFDRIKVYRRNIQIAYNMTEAEVINYHSGKRTPLNDLISHISVVSEAPILSKIEKLIIDSQAEIIVIDTIGDIELDDYMKKKNVDPIIPITKALRSILQRIEVIIIAIHHVSKHAVLDQKGKRKRLTLHSGLGSSYLEQKADTVIAIEGDQEDNIREVRSLKARDTNPFDIKTHMIKETFKFIALK